MRGREVYGFMRVENKGALIHRIQPFHGQHRRGGKGGRGGERKVC